MDPFVQDFLLTYRATSDGTTGCHRMNWCATDWCAPKWTFLFLWQKWPTSIGTTTQSGRRQPEGFENVHWCEKGSTCSKDQRGKLSQGKETFPCEKGTKFQRPTRVIRKASSSAFVLEDGRTWNATHLSLVPESETSRLPCPCSRDRVGSTTSWCWGHGQTYESEKGACLA